MVVSLAPHRAFAAPRVRQRVLPGGRVQSRGHGCAAHQCRAWADRELAGFLQGGPGRHAPRRCEPSIRSRRTSSTRAGTQIAVERTFLPFWPGKKAAGQPVRIAWVWPLIDQPHRGVCSAMLDNSLAASLGSGGLAGLLDAGRDYASVAKLTWAVDPALLDDTHAMTHSYQVLDGPNCWQVKSEPASSAARSWLATLHAVSRGPAGVRHALRRPRCGRADPSGSGQPTSRRRSATGQPSRASTSSSRTGRSHGPRTVIADAGVVDNLLAQDGSLHGGSVQGGIQTFVLDSGMMPPTNLALYYTPDAVASGAHRRRRDRARIACRSRSHHRARRQLSTGRLSTGGSATAAQPRAGPSPPRNVSSQRRP